jgi:hypothetical protein
MVVNQEVSVRPTTQHRAVAEAHVRALTSKGVVSIGINKGHAQGHTYRALTINGVVGVDAGGEGIVHVGYSGDGEPRP